MIIEENDTKKVMSYGHEMYMKGFTRGIIGTVGLYISYRLLKEYWTHEISKNSCEKQPS